MGQIEDLRLFTVIVDETSISKAADQLNIAKSAVSRRLSLLEDRLGTRLIDRGPGVWAITPTGRELYQRALRVVNDVNDINSDFAQAGSNLAGPLSISVPREFGLGFLMPALVRFRVKHPEIHLSIDFDDRAVDLSRENYDLAIRISANIESGVVVQKIGRSVHHLLASPKYLAKAELPKTLDDLATHPLMHFGSARRAVWEFDGGNGKLQSFAFQPTLNSNSGAFLVRAAEQGQGIVLAPDFLVENALATGSLIKVLPNLQIKERGIYIVHAEDRRINKRMRLFANEMVAACAIAMPAD